VTVGLGQLSRDGVRTPVSLTSSGALVAAQGAGVAIKLRSLVIGATSSVTVSLRDGAADVLPIRLLANASVVLPFSERGWMVTSANEALTHRVRGRQHGDGLRAVERGLMGLENLFDGYFTPDEAGLVSAWDDVLAGPPIYPTVDLLATSPEVLSGTGAAFLAPGGEDAYYLATSPEFLSGTGAALLAPGAAKALDEAGLLDELGAARAAVPASGWRAPRVSDYSGQGMRLPAVSSGGGSGGGGSISMPTISAPAAAGSVSALPVPPLATVAIPQTPPPANTFRPLVVESPRLSEPAISHGLGRLFDDPYATARRLSGMVR
jgi:hypothetical protein